MNLKETISEWTRDNPKFDVKYILAGGYYTIQVETKHLTIQYYHSMVCSTEYALDETINQHFISKLDELRDLIIKNLLEKHGIDYMREF